MQNVTDDDLTLINPRPPRELGPRFMHFLGAQLALGLGRVA